MFNSKPSKGELSRAHILQNALELFRERGFEETTMRDIAARCEISLGATYYYFPSKEAIMLAYYDDVQSRHKELASPLLAKEKSTAKRIALLHHLKLEILKDDREIMGALFRYGGDPNHELSPFSNTTRKIREECIQLFTEALEYESLPVDLQRLAPTLLWTMHMGILLYFLYDRSAGQKKTYKLADRGASLFVGAMTMAKLPGLKPIRKRVLEMLIEADLLGKR